LTEKKNLVAAAREVLKMGPKFVVIKKGEHGCLLVNQRDTFVLPAYPTETVVDPTGAGDSFAGGMMGYLSTQGNLSSATLKRALAFGTVLATATREHIDDRWQDFKGSMNF
jgi:sugar/nucleoside kinase (ribokinase family)